MSTPNVSAASQNTDQFVYIGTYGKGIQGFRFNAQSGALASLGMVAEVVNPSFLATDKDYRYIYAVSELEGDSPGGVASFGIEKKSGKLTPLNAVKSGGVAPCHLAVDRSSKTLVVANYMTGGVSSFPISHDGKLGEMSSLETAEGSGPNPKRQEGPHAHESVISHDDKLVYVPDLGLDRIRIYRLDAASAKLLPNDPPFVKVEAGHGPRHIAFDHNGKFAYVLNELKPLVTVFSVDSATGNLKEIQTVPTLPADFTKETTGAEIRLSPSGRFLYTSNRGNDSIQVFSIDGNAGRLKQVQSISTEGDGPRGFALDPAGRFLVVGNQNTNSLIVFKVDEKTGHLSSTGQNLVVQSPVDVLFVPSA